MIRRVLLVLALLAGPAVALAPSAQAAVRAWGDVDSAVQNTITYQIAVRGHAYDPRDPSASIGVRLFVGGKYAGWVKASSASPYFNRSRGLTGKHAYYATLSWPTTTKSVMAYSVRDGHWIKLATRSVAHVQPSQAERVISVAKQYVGKVRYRDGGASPSKGFDCSGYTKYVFAAAKVGKLPHNADAQRRMSRMHRVSASSARPGDLVFYQSGGYSFHVAIYAGRHMQYAAATVRDGIRYQRIWSSNVVYGRYS